MTQLLISVRNVEEALIALETSVDLIDLKDPENGALGALDLKISEQILQLVKQYRQLNPAQFPLTSATVGENHMNFACLQKAINSRVEMGLDIIKVAVSDLLYEDFTINDFDQVKLIAVFFADQSIDLSLLEKLKKSGFYGAMLDTQNKTQNLLEICTLSNLKMFTQACQNQSLKSGLAGSLQPQHVEKLVDIYPSYIGFRGGVCENNSRINELMPDKIVNMKNLLQQHNKLN